MTKKVIDYTQISDGDIPSVSIRWLEDKITQKKSVVIDYYYQVDNEKFTSISFEWQKEELEEIIKKL